MLFIFDEDLLGSINHEAAGQAYRLLATAYSIVILSYPPLEAVSYIRNPRTRHDVTRDAVSSSKQQLNKVSFI
jgi:hypothetical protein